jgi:hypothetical protein
VLPLIALFLAQIPPQASSTPPPESEIQSYQVYTEHPRMFLRPSRLKLLRRERERKSLRWEQFDTLMRGNAPMIQPGFADALYYRIADDKESGRKAVEFALGSKDIYQVALVYDWCQDILTETQKKRLAATLERGLTTPGKTFNDARLRLMAAIALDSDATVQEKNVKRFFDEDWTPRIKSLRAGQNVFAQNDIFALYEVLHMAQDNMQVDLRDQYPKYFKQLPLVSLMSYYPAPFPAAESEYRIPSTKNLKEPDLEQAALARVAQLQMVALDANAPESQVLQGWLMNDRFLMRGLFGIPYEMLWANPYQPGLSYYHVPLVLHDEIFGRLYVRSSWEDDATWAGFFDGQLQLFRDGQVTMLNPEISREPLDLEEATVFFGRDTHKLQLPPKEVNDAFIVGMKPNHVYQVEIDDEEMWEVTADPGGILYFPGLRGSIGLRFQEAPNLKSPTP